MTYFPISSGRHDNDKSLSVNSTKAFNCVKLFGKL